MGAFLASSILAATTGRSDRSDLVCYMQDKFETEQAWEQVPVQDDMCDKTGGHNPICFTEQLKTGGIIRGCADPKHDPKFEKSGCNYEDGDESCWVVCTETYCNNQEDVYHDEPESTTTSSTTSSTTTSLTTTIKSTTTTASSTDDPNTDVTDGAVINALSLFTVLLLN